MEEIMQSIISAKALHIGAGMRYLFLRIICRRKDVSYEKLCNSDKKDPIAYNDNAFANGCLGMVIIAILIILMVKYLG